MKRFRSRYARRVLVPVMAASVLSACTRWKVQEMAPSQVVSGEWPSEVRLTMLDGDKIELFDPTVSGGEIVGHPTRGWGYDRSDTLRVTTNSVAQIEILEANVVAIGIVVTLALVVAFLAPLIFSWSFPEEPD